MNGFFLASYAALWVLVVVLVVALLALYNHFGSMYLSSREGRAQQGPTLGAAAPAFSAAALDGGEVRLPSGRPALLLLASTDCPECARLAGPLRETAERHGERLDVVVLCGGPQQRVLAWAAERGLARDPRVRVVPDRNFRRAADLRVGITPFLVGVDGRGVVRTKGLVNGEDGLRRAVRDLLEESSPGAAHDDLRRIAVTGGPAR